MPRHQHEGIVPHPSLVRKVKAQALVYLEKGVMGTVRKTNTRRAEAKPDTSNLGRRLRALRRKIEASGQRLLTMSEIEREVVVRRGGVDLNHR